ncbi:hypothetical protein [Streptomyces iconiensis]|uniref:Secreted protein n=1 Tax=Streptomyces iconiensis TaxID=1384038 RepID=A0ABT7A7Q4_9ACTN|nr:hypothetical protein [Streptomyces iconiensis]MDJ1137362.1 hypothetical protein [Streptomyces iconiensis]
MSAISLILLCAAALAAALGGAALHTARGLRGQLNALRCQLEAERARTATHGVPHAREACEVRAAVAEALAEERERELAEARAFWAAQEARDAGPESGSLLAGHGTEYEVAQGDLADQLDAFADASGYDDSESGEIFIPRQAGPEEGDVDVQGTHGPLEGDEPEIEPPGLAAARRRHPSHPDFNLNGDPVHSPAPSTAPTVADHERTVDRLAELAGARTPLADVRPGPLGTLDVYVFADGTTVCLSPGHRATSEALSEALRLGEPPVLMGGSGVAGSYALTFGFPNGDTAYLLADRVIASH